MITRSLNDVSVYIDNPGSEPIHVGALFNTSGENVGYLNVRGQLDLSILFHRLSCSVFVTDYLPQYNMAAPSATYLLYYSEAEEKVFMKLESFRDVCNRNYRILPVSVANLIQSRESTAPGVVSSETPHSTDWESTDFDPFLVSQRAIAIASIELKLKE